MASATTVLDARYRLGPLIARGGMSDVYRAVDERTGADVAVKVVRSADPALASRMAREARALESLDHPNLVRLLASGLFDEQAYLVMAYVDGSTLAARLRRGPLEPAVAARLGAAVADALAYIHAHAIVHRDVKPANVLITTGGQIRLADFGVARLADASALTLAGTTLGTVAYMAPEQLENHQVGPTADVWSLGVVLLECLTGRRVYTGSPSEVIARRLTDPVPVPDAVPAPWRALLGRMLDRSPEQRPTASEVAQWLGAPAFSAPWDPWGEPVRDDAGETARLGAAPVADEGTDAYRAGHLRPEPRRASRRRGVAVAVLLAAVGAAVLGAWAASNGSGSAKHPAPPVSTTGRPAAPTTAPAPTATSELSALSGHLNAGVAAGSLASQPAATVISDARQAITDAGAGSAAQAASDLQRAVNVITAGIADGSVTSAQAQVLKHDLSALASTLGVPVPTAAPVTPTSLAPAAPRPAGHKHHGQGNGD
jgi:hypothetical protein